jgi:CubicO group peptidase (beta-lactamase class C family)
MWQDPHYADGAYAIIGRALESVVGMTWEDYLTQHIFKPLGTIILPALSAEGGWACLTRGRNPGMDSTFVAYDGWSDMAKRVAPGMIGNTSLPYLLSQMDLRWARPTGNVYDHTHDTHDTHTNLIT